MSDYVEAITQSLRSTSTDTLPLLLRLSFTKLSLLSLSLFLCINLMADHVNAQPDPVMSSKTANGDTHYVYKKPVKKKITALQARTSSLMIDVPFVQVQTATQQLQTLGFWHMITNRLNFGMNIGFSLDQADVVTREAIQGQTEERTQQTQTDFIFSPGFKYYTRSQSKVALFFISQLHMRSYNDGDTQTISDKKATGEQEYNPEEDLQLSATLGFGAEWFPVKSFSLGWHIGLNMYILRQGWQGFAMETYTSALKAHIYF
jgi:hypothetical protein